MLVLDSGAVTKLARRDRQTCDLIIEVPEETARRAAQLRFRAKRGSAVDALVIAFAGPAGRVLTGDPGDLRALAAHADHVLVETI